MSPETAQRVWRGFGGDMAANEEEGQGRVVVAGVACGHAGAEEEEQEEVEEGDQHDVYPPLEDQVENSYDVSLVLSLPVFFFLSLTFFLSLLLSVSLSLYLSHSVSLYLSLSRARSLSERETKV